MWSVGVLMYLLLSGKLPFDGATMSEVFDKIKKGSCRLQGTEWTNIPLTAKDLIKNLLRTDPLDRLDAADSLSHQFFIDAQRDLE